MICNIGMVLALISAKKLKAAKYVKYHNLICISDLEYPFKHPNIYILDIEYDNLVYKCARGNGIKRWIGR